MKRLAALFWSLILCAACASTPSSASTSNGGACNTQAAVEWHGSNDARFSVTASTIGPRCAQSVALLVVRNNAGDVIWTDAIAVSDVIGLNEPRTRSAMTLALRDWISAPMTGLRTTADLQPWARTSGQADKSEFPFSPEDWIGEEFYERLAGERQPMFCYAQGRESLACLVEFDDRLEKIGVQSFPG